MQEGACEACRQTRRPAVRLTCGHNHTLAGYDGAVSLRLMAVEGILTQVLEDTQKHLRKAEVASPTAWTAG